MESTYPPDLSQGARILGVEFICRENGFFLFGWLF